MESKVKIYKKGSGIQLSPHFTSDDFDCKCSLPTCDHTLIDDDLIDGLEMLWVRVDGLWLSSGFRCGAHNRAVGGEPGSYHMLGKAGDAQSHSLPQQVQTIAGSIFVFKNGGIGRGKTFTHLDVRGYPARWNYP